MPLSAFSLGCNLNTELREHLGLTSLFYKQDSFDIHCRYDGLTSLPDDSGQINLNNK